MNESTLCKKLAEALKKERAEKLRPGESFNESNRPSEDPSTKALEKDITRRGSLA